MTDTSTRPTDAPATADADDEQSTPAPTADLWVRVVGPAGRDSGGIAQYIAAQREHVGDAVDFSVYDVAVAAGSGPRWFLGALLTAALDALLFPVRTRDDVDVAHVHTSHRRSFYQSSFYVLFASLVRGTPVVLHVHGSSFDTFVEEASLPLRLYQRAVFAACERVVVLSPHWADVVSGRVPDGQVVVLPNAVDAAAFRPAPGADPPRVAFVSNHIERKGIEEFVDAVDTLLAEAGDDTDPPFRVDVAGDGPLAHRAESLAERHDAVEYHGYVSEARKRELLADASVYALPTYAEGLPIAILEAMAGGNAVVSTGVGAIPSVVDEGNGLLVTPGDADALAGALDALTASPASTRRLGAESRRRVEARYDWAAVGTRLVDLYREVGDTGTEAGTEARTGAGMETGAEKE